MLEIRDIIHRIPHRYPFLLVDRIVEVEAGKRIVGIKNVTTNETFFQGHFPGRPIMPGVLICEAMAQVGAVLAHYSRAQSDDRHVLVLTGLDRVKFKRAVTPGDQLRLELSSVKRRGTFWKMRGVATVEGKVVAQAEISAMEVPLE